MAKLKVWCGNYDGTNGRMVAARSQKEAARLLGITLGELRRYYGVRTEDEIRGGGDILALDEPGSVWETPLTTYPAQWRRIKSAPPKWPAVRRREGERAMEDMAEEEMLQAEHDDRTGRDELLIVACEAFIRLDDRGGEISAGEWNAAIVLARAAIAHAKGGPS